MMIILVGIVVVCATWFGVMGIKRYNLSMDINQVAQVKKDEPTSTSLVEQKHLFDAFPERGQRAFYILRHLETYKSTLQSQIDARINEIVAILEREVREAAVKMLDEKINEERKRLEFIVAESEKCEARVEKYTTNGWWRSTSNTANGTIGDPFLWRQAFWNLSVGCLCT